MLDGLMLMPRTVDKLRSRLPGGHPGEYVIDLAKSVRGVSGFLLERLGISEAELLAAVERAQTDDDVAEWLRTRVDPAIYPHINATLRRIQPRHSDDEELFRRIYAETLAANPQLEFILDIVEADDRRIFAARH
jgi:hypothetical protein